MLAKANQVSGLNIGTFRNCILYEEHTSWLCMYHMFDICECYEMICLRYDITMNVICE